MYKKRQTLRSKLPKLKDLIYKNYLSILLYGFGFITLFGLIGFVIMKLIPIPTLWIESSDPYPLNLIVQEEMSYKFTQYKGLDFSVYSIKQSIPHDFSFQVLSGKDLYTVSSEWSYLNSIPLYGFQVTGTTFRRISGELMLSRLFIPKEYWNSLVLYSLEPMNRVLTTRSANTLNWTCSQAGTYILAVELFPVSTIDKTHIQYSHQTYSVSWPTIYTQEQSALALLQESETLVSKYAYKPLSTSEPSSYTSWILNQIHSLLTNSEFIQKQKKLKNTTWLSNHLLPKQSSFVLSGMEHIENYLYKHRGFPKPNNCLKLDLDLLSIWNYPKGKFCTSTPLGSADPQIHINFSKLMVLPISIIKKEEHRIHDDFLLDLTEEVFIAENQQNNVYSHDFLSAYGQLLREEASFFFKERSWVDIVCPSSHTSSDHKIFSLDFFRFLRNHYYQKSKEDFLLNLAQNLKKSTSSIAETEILYSITSGSLSMLQQDFVNFCTENSSTFYFQALKENTISLTLETPLFYGEIRRPPAFSTKISSIQLSNIPKEKLNGSKILFYYPKTLYPDFSLLQYFPGGSSTKKFFTYSMGTPLIMDAQLCTKLYINQIAGSYSPKTSSNYTIALLQKPDKANAYIHNNLLIIQWTASPLAHLDLVDKYKIYILPENKKIPIIRYSKIPSIEIPLEELTSDDTSKNIEIFYKEQIHVDSFTIFSPASPPTNFTLYSSKDCTYSMFYGTWKGICPSSGEEITLNITSGSASCNLLITQKIENHTTSQYNGQLDAQNQACYLYQYDQNQKSYEKISSTKIYFLSEKEAWFPTYGCTMMKER